MALNVLKKIESEAVTTSTDSTLPASKIRPAQNASEMVETNQQAGRVDLTAVPIVGPIIGRMLKSRRFQFSFILPSQIIFWLVVISGFLGTAEATQNFGTAITWYIWFALMFPATLLLGRAWCVTCPFGGFGEWIQRKTFFKRAQSTLGLGWKMPKSVARYGLVISAIVFIGMTWAEEFLNIAGPGAPFLTSLMILAIIGSAALVFLLFERRTFCRYICPLSSLLGTAGSTGVMAGFRPKDKETCLKCQTKDCMRGGEKGYGCPWYTYPSSADTNTYCGLCSECYKACPYDNVSIYAQKPLTSVIEPKKRTELAWVVALLFGLVIFQQWNALGSYTAVDGWLNNLIHFPSYPNPIDYILAIAGVGGILAGLAFLASRTLSNADKTARSFAAWFAPLMYGIIPLMGADFLARVMPKFFNHAARLPSSIAGLFGNQVSWADFHILPNDWVVRLQFMTVGLGTVAAVYTTSKITEKNLKVLSRHPKLARVLPIVIVVAIGIGIIALYAAMNGAE